MATVTFACPDCELDVGLAMPVARTAVEFCPRCDFPMFWAPEVEAYEPPADPAGSGDSGDQGAGRTREPVTNRIHCGTCAAVNQEHWPYCYRCGRPLHPEPDLLPRWVAPVVGALLLLLVIVLVVVGVALA